MRLSVMRECAVGASRSASGFGCDEFPAAPRFTADAGSPAENARFERSAPVRSTTVSVQPVSTWEPNQLGWPRVFSCSEKGPRRRIRMLRGACIRIAKGADRL
jgi:hypothetical protein